MPTINRLVRRGGKSKTYKSDSPALSRNFNSVKKSYTEANSPQKRGVCISVRTVTPKKPSSAPRKVARVRLINGMEVLSYTPGTGYSLQEYGAALVRGGRVRGLPGIRYHTIRGALDTAAVQNRAQGRSRYGTKKPKKQNKNKRY